MGGEQVKYTLGLVYLSFGGVTGGIGILSGFIGAFFVVGTLGEWTLVCELLPVVELPELLFSILFISFKIHTKVFVCLLISLIYGKPVFGEYIIS